MFLAFVFVAAGCVNAAEEPPGPVLYAPEGAEQPGPWVARLAPGASADLWRIEPSRPGQSFVMTATVEWGEAWVGGCLSLRAANKGQDMALIAGDDGIQLGSSGVPGLPLLDLVGGFVYMETVATDRPFPLLLVAAPSAGGASFDLAEIKVRSDAPFSALHLGAPEVECAARPQDFEESEMWSVGGMVAQGAVADDLAVPHRAYSWALVAGNSYDLRFETGEGVAYEAKHTGADRQMSSAMILSDGPAARISIAELRGDARAAFVHVALDRDTLDAFEIAVGDARSNISI